MLGDEPSSWWLTLLMLLGMEAAGLADLYGSRTMMQITAYVNLAIGIVALLAPGIGRPDLDWVRNTLLLRKASSGPLLPPGRPATMADIDRLIFHLPALAVLNEAERVRLAAAALVLHAAEGTVIIRKGDISDALFFVLEGSAFAGRHEKGRERLLSVHTADDFFGEIAALTGIQRTAEVIANRPTTLLSVPASMLQEMAIYPDINQLFLQKTNERWLRTEAVEMPKVRILGYQSLNDLRMALSET